MNTDITIKIFDAAAEARELSRLEAARDEAKRRHDDMYARFCAEAPADVIEAYRQTHRDCRGGLGDRDYGWRDLCIAEADLRSHADWMTRPKENGMYIYCRNSYDHRDALKSRRYRFSAGDKWWTRGMPLATADDVRAAIAEIEWLAARGEVNNQEQSMRQLEEMIEVMA